MIPSLSGIRGLAALWVMLYHLQLLLGGYARWLAAVPLLRLGWTAVDLFFILSGFALMHGHGAELATGGRSALLRFARGRIGRIYPVNLAVLALLALLFAADPSFAHWLASLGKGDLSAIAFLKAGLLATRWFLPWRGEVNPPLWSLSLEMLGYAVLPLLAPWLMTRRSPAALLAVTAGMLLALLLYRITLGIPDRNDYAQFGGAVRMALCFGAGTTLYRLRQLAPSGLARHAAAGAALSAACVLVLCRNAWLVAALPLDFAALILFLSYRRGLVDRLLSTRAALFLGRISFPLYLVHQIPLMWVMYQVLEGPLWDGRFRLAIIAGYLGAMLAIAYLLHIAVERPAHAWARRQDPAAPRPLASGMEEAGQPQGVRAAAEDAGIEACAEPDSTSRVSIII